MTDVRFIWHVQRCRCITVGKVCPTAKLIMNVAFIVGKTTEAAHPQVIEGKKAAPPPPPYPQVIQEKATTAAHPQVI